MTKTANSWFVADKEGIRTLYADKDKGFLVRELLQNSLDEPGVTRVNITLDRVPNSPMVELLVSDDAPEGFYDLKHAFTLFASTRKRVDPKMRGRFNLGEKQVLSLCDSAKIITTKGEVVFYKDGTRTEDTSTCTKFGSIFTAMIRMTEKERMEVVNAVDTFLVPRNVEVYFNRVRLEYRESINAFEASLLTECSNDDGVMRMTTRKATVRIVEPKDGETPMLYELGLPVCETEDKWHYDVQQRVPLGVDRDTVRPSFLRDLRAEVLNQMYVDLDVEDAAEHWVQDALQDERVSGEAVTTVVTKQHGNRAFVPTPGDAQANERAMEAGYHSVGGGAYSKAAWENIRTKTKALPAATTVAGKTQMVGAEPVPASEWTTGMAQFAALAKYVAKKCVGLGFDINVRFVRCKAAKDIMAQYGERTFTVNLSNVGKVWFNDMPSQRHYRLIIHELGHEFGGHYDQSYHAALCNIGAWLATTNPQVFEDVAEAVQEVTT